MKARVIFLICSFWALSCGKQNKWLDAPRTQDEKIPDSLEDFQAILDNTEIFNVNYPSIGLLGCDNYYLQDEQYNAIPQTERNSYIWAKDIFDERPSLDYLSGYQLINHANIVLAGIEDVKIDQSDISNFRNIKGQALFFRAFTFLELATVFCKQYNLTTSDKDLGICLKLRSDINEITPRSTIAETYSRIIDDLLQASELLPVSQKHKTRPSKQAAYALLARVYLIMGNYAKARDFADSVFTISNTLLDYNSGIPNFDYQYRFPSFRLNNDEVIFYARSIGYYAVIPSYDFNLGFVDTALYNSYSSDDLRKKYFYEYIDPQKIKFRGTYSGSEHAFAGLGMNEVYFIHAECNVRLNSVSDALRDLNTLLRKRIEKNKYEDYNTSNPSLALAKILEERRKELPFTGQLRWQDLRRLNADPNLAISLIRVINGTTFILPANDPKYVYPIPQEEIIRTGIEQNAR